MSRDALVLGGGGARGAWQAGVLRYLCREMPAELGDSLRFDLLVGTSVGALNAAFMAAEAGRPDTAGERLAEHWRSIELSAVYRMRLRRLWRVPFSLLRATGRPRGEIALLDGSPLTEVVSRRVDWRGISRALEEGHLQGLAVTATELSSTRNVVFHQVAPGVEVPSEGGRDSMRFVEATIGTQHIQASTALPLLFPPVKLGGRWYLDGGLGEQTPMRPAVALGADRVLALSLAKLVGPADIEGDDTDPGAEPTWPRVIGKTMNAVLLDRSEPESARRQRVNRLLAWGNERQARLLRAGAERWGDDFVSWAEEILARDAFPVDFAEGLEAVMSDDRDAPWRRVESMVLCPSVDLGVLASQTMDRGLRGEVNELTRLVFDFLDDTAQAGDADALSYILFDPAYLHALLELGEADAAAHHDELAAFLAERNEQGGV